MKAILLARVSSREQQGGMSIPAQERRLREYSERKGLVVDQVFAITESSTRGARKEFEKVIQAIQKAKEPVALIADTVDNNGNKQSSQTPTSPPSSAKCSNYTPPAPTRSQNFVMQ